MVLASGVAAPEIRFGFYPERRPQDAQDACIPLRWSITQLSDVYQRGNESAVEKWLANKWWPCTVPATTLLPRRLESSSWCETCAASASSRTSKLRYFIPFAAISSRAWLMCRAIESWLSCDVCAIVIFRVASLA